jgi:hypothetical protein
MVRDWAGFAIHACNRRRGRRDRLEYLRKLSFALCLQSRQDGHSRAAMDAFLRDH